MSREGAAGNAPQEPRAPDTLQPYPKQQRKYHRRKHRVVPSTLNAKQKITIINQKTTLPKRTLARH